VNLYLRVLGRRPDGYHELVTVMQPLTLADELTIAPAGGGLSLECDAVSLPGGEGNLVWRAAVLFGQETGREPAVHITLRKKIPVAAGLGGGSSDAAGTLKALNALYGEPLKADALHRLAGQLGADVPFFLSEGPAVGRGTGTRLTPLVLPPYWYVLLNPGVPLSTRWVYAHLDLESLPRLPERDDWDPAHPEEWVHNDLEGVAVRRLPELVSLLAGLESWGAEAQAVSGSGPTVFGLFSALEAARQAAQELRRVFPGWIAVCRGLTGSATDLNWENQSWMV
jgi:4-diphosphocytidyl-2-C-methyl-D-erythritol kinase